MSDQLDDGGMTVARWTAKADAMSKTTAALKSAGEWRRGPRHTLLRAVGRDEHELTMVAALAWLLAPDEHHGLGDGVLRALLHRFGLAFNPEMPVRIAVEEYRWDQDGSTRADLIIRTGGACAIIEAKIHAGEQRRQRQRLARQWMDEQPTLIYLNRTGRDPYRTDPHDLDATGWLFLSWADVADMIEVASVGRPASHGALDVMETLRTSHGRHGTGPKMTNDATTAFVLDHWEQIGEWKTLRDEYIGQVTKHLEGNARLLAADVPEDGICEMELPKRTNAIVADGNSLPDNDYWIQLRKDTWNIRGHHINLALGWFPRKMLIPTSSATFPYIGLRIPSARKRDRDLATFLRCELATIADELDWRVIESDSDYWPMYGFVKPGTSDPADYARRCCDSFQHAWAVTEHALDKLSQQAAR